MDDDFEIDLYGDDDTETQQDPAQPEPKVQGQDVPPVEDIANRTSETTTNGHANPAGLDGVQYASDNASHAANDAETTSPITNRTSDIKLEETSDTAPTTAAVPTPVEAERGLKRRENDERPIDPNASSALIISDMQWWQTDDDIRGWARYCDCEDELIDITFSEHKVNGKSKGQAYIELETPQACTSLKSYLENPPASTPKHKSPKRHAVAFASPTTNPFRTHPKDAPTRSGSAGPHGVGAGRGNYESGGRGGFRGRGGGGGRGMGGYNRGGGGYGGYNNGAGMATAANMGGLQPNFGRGGGMGAMGGMNPMMARGGGARGGMGGMGGMGMMAGMAGMGGMGMGMPMMGMPQGGFNPAFFQGQAGQGQGMGMAAGMNGTGMGSARPGGQQGDWNPHGAKRLRPE